MKKNTSGNGSFWAMMCHLSTLLGFLIPGFSLIAPLMIWGFKRKENNLVDENGRNIINFILSFWLYSLGLVIVFGIVFVLLFMYNAMVLNIFPALWLSFYGGAVAIYGLIYGIFHLVLPIVGAIKAAQGEVYVYPLSIPFLKGTETIGLTHKSSAK